MSSIGLHNLLFSGVSESETTVSALLGGSPGALGQTEQVLPPSADFSTLIQSLLTHTQAPLSQTITPETTKDAGWVEIEDFLSEVLGHHVEVTPLGEMEGFEFFQISLPKPAISSDLRESDSFSTHARNVREAFSQFLPRVDSTGLNEGTGTEAAEAFPNYLLVGQGAVQPNPAEPRITGEVKPKDSLPVFVFLFFGNPPVKISDLTQSNEGVVKPPEGNLPQPSSSEGSASPKPVAITVLTVPMSRHSDEPSIPQQKPSEDPVGKTVDSAKPSIESEFEAAVERETSNRKDSIRASITRASNDELTLEGNRSRVDLKRGETVVDTERTVDPKLPVKGEASSPPIETWSAEDSRVSSAEVEGKDGNRSLRPEEKIEFHPRLIESIHKVVKQIVDSAEPNRPTPAVGRENQGHSNLQSQRAQITTSSIESSSAEAPETKTILQDKPNLPMPVPVTLVEDASIDPSRVIKVPRTPGGSVTTPPIDRNILVSESTVQKDAAPASESKKNETPSPVPRRSVVDPPDLDRNPNRPPVKTQVRVKILTGDLAKKLESLSGKIIGTRTFSSSVPRSPIPQSESPVTPEPKPRTSTKAETSKPGIVQDTTPTSAFPNNRSSRPEVRTTAKYPSPDPGPIKLAQPSKVSPASPQIPPKQLVRIATDSRPPTPPPSAPPQEVSVEPSIMRDRETDRPQPAAGIGDGPTKSEERLPVGKTTAEPIPKNLGSMKEATDPKHHSSTPEGKPRGEGPQNRPSDVPIKSVAPPPSREVALTSQPVTQQVAPNSQRNLGQTIQGVPDETERARVTVGEPKSLVVQKPQAPLSNSIQPPPAQESSVVDQMTRNLQGRSLSNGSEMRVRLVPENLGEIHLKVTVRDGQIIAEIRATSEVTREILSKNSVQLQSLLADSGAGMEKVIVRTGNFGSDFQGPLSQQREGAQQHDSKEGGKDQSKDSDGDHSQRRDDSRKDGRRGAWERFA